jgi:flagellin
MLQRMKALASQSVSGTVTDSERAYIDAEFSQLAEEIDGISESTRYNGASLLDGTSDFANGMVVVVGSNATSDTIKVTIDALTTSALDITAATDEAPASLVGSASGYDASGGDVSFTVNGTSVTLSATGGTASDGVYTADDIATAINTALGTSTVSASVDATTGKLTLSNTATGSTAGITIAGTGSFDVADLGFDDTSSTGRDAAAIDKVSSARANIGALESRFEFRSNTIATSIENLEAANSAIKDVDVASESATLAAVKVKTQAAVAAAAQANQMPQDLLKLLQ